MVRRFPARRKQSHLLVVFFIAAASIIRLAAFQNARPVNIGNPSTREDFEAGDANRERQRATDLVTVLQLAPGNWAADVGAGGGFYSMRMAETVGPSGKVFAEDISDSSIRWLQLRISLFHLSNVEVVKGEEDDPHLPAGRLSGILIVDSYHHFAKYETMLKKLMEALEPGGRLVIADYSFAEHRLQPRADQLALHEIDPNLARKELTSAGFTIVNLDEAFLKWNPSGPNWKPVHSDMWVMTAIRPNLRGSSK